MGHLFALTNPNSGRSGLSYHAGMKPERPLGNKTCTKCQQEKPTSEFHWRMRRGKYILESWCKPCCRAYSSGYSKRTGHFSQTRWKEQNQQKARASLLLSGARHRARKHGRQCTITREWIEQKLDAGHCEVTGLPFEYETSGYSAKNPWAPSVDRRDNKKDYTPENCQVVVWAYNVAKAEFSAEDFHKLCLALAKPLIQRGLASGRLRLVA